MRNNFIKQLHELSEVDQNVCCLVGDNGAIVFDAYRRDFPNKFINVGISEATMVSVAAGLSSLGMIPFVYTIIPFLVMRAFEQIRVDVCIQKMNVKLVGIGAGFRYSSLGPTHHAIEDIALMRSLPGMTVFSPGDGNETREVVREAAKIKGPVYIRLGTNNEPMIEDRLEYNDEKGFSLYGAEKGRILLISSGNALFDALEAQSFLKKEGCSISVLNMVKLKPVCKKELYEVLVAFKDIYTLEHHSTIGGLGDLIRSVLLEGGNVSSGFFKAIGIDDKYESEYGDFEYLKRKNGLDASSIVNEIKQRL